MKRLLIALLLCVVVSAAAEPAGPRGMHRYILVLEDSPGALQASAQKGLRMQAAGGASMKIRAAQSALKTELANRKIKVIGSVQDVMNAVFVSAPNSTAAQLSALPGVKQVLPSVAMKLRLTRSLPLAEAQRAMSALSAGSQAADGTGVKIGIIDTGIDQSHPAFQDPSLPAATVSLTANRPNDAAYTNRKVIVARSYVPDVAAGFADDPALDSRPDDYSPRDRVGHGTAVAAIAAGVPHKAPNGIDVAGVAPKAYLGSYKIYGSPGVNDVTYSDVLILALEDAYRDGMNVVTVLFGYSLAKFGPLDRGSVCSDTDPNRICDPTANAIEDAITNLSESRMTVVVNAGDDGDLGVKTPTLNTINTPGNTPSAITVGAITTAQDWVSTVTVTGAGVPANLTAIPARFGDGPKPPGPVTGPLRDSGQACSAIAAGSLNGAIALIQRGGQCGFSTKVLNAQKAGAAGVILYQTQDRDYLIDPVGLATTARATLLVDYTHGQALKDFIAANPDRPVTLDLTLRSIPDTPDRVAVFSSRGPAVGTWAIKPEVVAPGKGIYTATQKYDANGSLYDPSGYTAVQFTHFSVGYVAGAAALVRQANPTFGYGKVKSALVNTALEGVLDAGAAARVTAVGAGKLDADAAARTTVTVEPATLSFGILTAASMPSRQVLTITNTGPTAVNLTFEVAPQNQLTVLNPPLTLVPGGYQQVTVELGGALPSAGSYEGVLKITGGAVPLRVPYLYMVANNTAAAAYNVFPIQGLGFEGLPGQLVPNDYLAFRLIDQYGIPINGFATANTAIPGLEVAFRSTLGGGHMWNDPATPLVDPATDRYGNAAGWAYLGPTVGEQEFTATVAGMTVTFGGVAVQRSQVNAGGVLNAAQPAAGLTPGSYASIYGQFLGESEMWLRTAYLPVSLGGVSVSFDLPDAQPGWPAQIGGYPGHIHYVSPLQVNVQIPWELQGKTSARMKVSIGGYSSDPPYSVALAEVAPSVFERMDAGAAIAAAQDVNFKVIDSTNGAKRGEYVQIYASGLGPVTNQPASGDPGPAADSPGGLATTVNEVQVTICGKPAAGPWDWSGLAPGMVALYQVNALVPADCGTGLQDLEITVTGVTAKSKLYVQ